MDLPGVSRARVRVLIKGDVVLVAGEKWAARRARGAGGYHLVERGSGRFARAVRLAARLRRRARARDAASTASSA